MSNTLGFGPHAVGRAVAAQAGRGLQFLLPGEDALAVAHTLRERTGLPFWQFTLSASGANVEAVRIARAVTGRERLVVFAGNYHGHIDFLDRHREVDIADTPGLALGGTTYASALAMAGARAALA